MTHKDHKLPIYLIHNLKSSLENMKGSQARGSQTKHQKFFYLLGYNGNWAALISPSSCLIFDTHNLIYLVSFESTQNWIVILWWATVWQFGNSQVKPFCTKQHRAWRDLNTINILMLAEVGTHWSSECMPKHLIPCRVLATFELWNYIYRCSVWYGYYHWYLRWCRWYLEETPVYLLIGSKTRNTIQQIAAGGSAWWEELQCLFFMCLKNAPSHFEPPNGVSYWIRSPNPEVTGNDITTSYIQWDFE